VFSHGQFMSAVAWLTLTRPANIDSAAMRRYFQFIQATTVPNCAILQLYLHADGSRAVGTLQVPVNVELGTIREVEAGLAGV
jgi:hypothetical protein